MSIKSFFMMYIETKTKKTEIKKNTKNKRITAKTTKKKLTAMIVIDNFTMAIAADEDLDSVFLLTHVHGDHVSIPIHFPFKIHTTPGNIALLASSSFSELPPPQLTATFSELYVPVHFGSSITVVALSNFHAPSSVSFLYTVNGGHSWTLHLGDSCFVPSVQGRAWGDENCDSALFARVDTIVCDELRPVSEEEEESKPYSAQIIEYMRENDLASLKIVPKHYGHVNVISQIAQQMNVRVDDYDTCVFQENSTQSHLTLVRALDTVMETKNKKKKNNNKKKKKNTITIVCVGNKRSTRDIISSFNEPPSQVVILSERWFTHVATNVSRAKVVNDYENGGVGRMFCKTHATMLDINMLVSFLRAKGNDNHLKLHVTGEKGGTYHHQKNWNK
jgi:hypothetical protein